MNKQNLVFAILFTNEKNTVNARDACLTFNKAFYHQICNNPDGIKVERGGNF